MDNLTSLLVKATGETLYIVFTASFFSLFFGLMLGTLLFITKNNASIPSKIVNRLLGFAINVGRSLPFIILMIVLTPVTRKLIGTSIGTNAAIVPLTIAAIPFFARICDNAFSAVPHGLLETAQAMGATRWQTILKILIPESLPALIRGATLTIVALIGYSAMAGVVGGGGLGELAINYGYQRFDIKIMLETVIILVLMVQLIQILGDKLAASHAIKPTLLISIAILISVVSFQCLPTAAVNSNVLKVGVMNGWPEEVMKVAMDEAKKTYGLTLKNCDV